MVRRAGCSAALSFSQSGVPVARSAVQYCSFRDSSLTLQEDQIPAQGASLRCLCAFLTTRMHLSTVGWMVMLSGMLSGLTVPPHDPAVRLALPMLLQVMCALIFSLSSARASGFPHRPALCFIFILLCHRTVVVHLDSRASLPKVDR